MLNNKREKQVPTELYNSFLKYSNYERWVSYYYQTKEILSGDFVSMLEIGVGNKILKLMIENQSSLHYQSMDIDSSLRPNIVGSVTSIPLKDKSVDLVCAFQILEHLSFEEFERSLSEMARVSKRKVFISLPHFGPPIKIKFKIPFLKEVVFAYKIPYPQKHKFNGHHYWEIGKKGYSLKMIRAVIEKYFFIEKEYIPFDNQYHHFFILKLKNK
ncbi:MAG: class I SAM-dependent methyltransferase [Candidatus Pacebacteria bacterium]|nr:class I SAM-dependent methyltransferase [Candidatus Paceibacterota bacterium]